MSNDYYEVYQSRAGHLGINPQQRAFRSGILEFNKTLKYSEHTIYGLKHNNDVFDGIILTKKQEEGVVREELLVALDVDVHVGDLVEWNNEQWLLYEEKVSSYQPYKKFFIVLCETYLKWVDDDGVAHASWAHVLGSRDSKIQDNFRTWNALITPQPNKHIEIIMPYQVIPKTTEIVLFEEAWYLVDYDRVSVPSIIYMSFTESKVNTLRDDVADQLANADKLQVWSIVANAITVKVNTEFLPQYTIYCDGVAQSDITPTISYTGNYMTKNNNGKYVITQMSSGCKFTIAYNGVTATQNITTTQSDTNNYLIEGNNYIRVSQSETYTVKNMMPNPASITSAALSDSTLGTCTIGANNTVIVKANDKNKLGTTTLTVQLGNQITVTKPIQIISLWQVI